MSDWKSEAIGLYRESVEEAEEAERKRMARIQADYLGQAKDLLTAMGLTDTEAASVTVIDCDNYGIFLELDGVYMRYMPKDNSAGIGRHIRLHSKPCLKCNSRKYSNIVLTEHESLVDIGRALSTLPALAIPHLIGDDEKCWGHDGGDDNADDQEGEE